MARSLTRWLTSLSALVLWAGSTAAQQQQQPETGPSGSPPVLGYFLAFAFLVLSLVIVCMPSRKQ